LRLVVVVVAERDEVVGGVGAALAACDEVVDFEAVGTAAADAAPAVTLQDLFADSAARWNPR